jgi:hypothetical protein
MAKTTVTVETWAQRKQPRDPVTGKFLPAEGEPRRVGRVVVRNPDGTLHGATNFRLRTRVGQVAKARRA